MGKAPAGTVKETGAFTGDCLIGIKPHNKNLIIVISENIERNQGGGRIPCQFHLLHEGNGEYASFIHPNVNNSFFSDDLINAIQNHPGGEKCTHLLNKNCLVKLDNLTSFYYAENI
ncbi:hypothetical protein K8I31_06770 [bacterium]|nr:hypothetical protein [bacterium]